MAFLTDEEMGALSDYAAPQRPATPSSRPADAQSDGLGHWWDSNTQSWQNDSGGAYQEPAIPSQRVGSQADRAGYETMPTDVGSLPATPYGSMPVGSAWDRAGYESPVMQPEWSDIADNYRAQQAWYDTPNEGRAGSQFDRMGFQEAPTNRELVDWQRQQAERNAALGNVMGFAKKAAGAVNPYKGGAYSLPGMDLSMSEMVANLRPEDTGWGAVGRGLNSVGGGLKSGYNWLDENALRPFEETAAQLTGPLLLGHKIASAAGAGIPGLAPAIAGIEAATGWHPDMGGIGQLAGSATSGDFIGEQNRKFSERPGIQQAMASTIYDPTNLAGAGIGGAVLKAGKGGKVVRALAGADKALDVLQTKATLPAIGAVAGGVAAHQAGGDWRQGAVAGGVAGLLGPAAVKQVPGAAKAVARAIPVITPRLAGETGALDMGAVGDMAGAARRSLPGRAVAKVSPLGMEVSLGAAEAGGRVGDLLHLPTVEALGPNPTPAQTLKVATTAEKRAATVANTLNAEAEVEFRPLGKTKTIDIGDTTPNVVEYYPGIKPTEWEVQRGIPGAAALRVHEQPGLYDLTPRQATAIKKLDDINKRIAAERDTLGAPVNRIASEEGEVWMHRRAVTPTETTQAEQLVREASPTANELNQPIGSRRLSVPKDKSRTFDDVSDAIDAGVQYAPVKQAFEENVATGLKKAANAHVASLLKPFAETSADRLSPEFKAVVEGAKNITQRLEGRLNTALKRAGISTGKGDELASMLEKQATGAAISLDAAPREISTINRFLTRAQNRIVELRQRGGKYVDEANALQDMLDDARANVDDILPQWEAAKKAATAIPSARRTVPMETAPALQGMDFDRNTAARIIAHYGGGIRIGDTVHGSNLIGVNRLNNILRPLQATGDFSVTAMQLGMVGAAHPVRFAKNFVKSMGDMFNDTNYNKWLTSKGDSAKWVTIHGGAGPQGDFLSHTLAKLPGFKQMQKQFERFGNRMRVDAYEAIADSAAKSAKHEIDDLAKEQIGKAVDRATGVANTRATDLEGMAQFAPNFFRAVIESTGHAAMDGGLEGQIARQYIKTYASLGTGMVVAAAIAQDRPLSDVLSPFDKEAWAKGQIKLNPNWMSIRVAGQDVKIFGTYDSAIRLAVVASDSAYQAVTQKDAYKLFDFVDYATGTKGSPVVSFIHDLFAKETFGGEDPLSASALSKRVMPFTAGAAITDVQQGMGLKDVIADVGLSALGFKSSPVTQTEKYAEDYTSWAKEQGLTGIDLNYDTANATKVKEFEAVHGKTAPTSKEGIEGKAQSDAIRGELVADQFNLDLTHLNHEGGILNPFGKATWTPKSPDEGRAYREGTHLVDTEAAGAYLAKGIIDPYTGKERTDPTSQALKAYYTEIEKSKVGAKPDFNAVEAWLATHPEEAKLIDEYKKATGDTDRTAGEKAYHDAYEGVRDSGFFDVRDAAWVAAQRQYPTAAKYESSDAMMAVLIPKWTAEYESKGDSRDKALKKATDDFYNGPFYKGMSEAATKAEDAWILANPDAAVTAWRWGYFTPDDKQIAWLDKYIKKNGK